MVFRDMKFTTGTFKTTRSTRNEWGGGRTRSEQNIAPLSLLQKVLRSSPDSREEVCGHTCSAGPENLESPLLPDFN